MHINYGACGVYEEISICGRTLRADFRFPFLRFITVFFYFCSSFFVMECTVSDELIAFMAKYQFYVNQNM